LRGGGKEGTVVRRAARKDDNQAEIVKRLREAGVKVRILNEPDLPDLLIGHRFNFWLFEVKDGAKPPSRRKLREGQETFAQEWSGYPIVKIESLDEALRTLGFKRNSPSG
jgi:hypothetical protein